MTPRSPLAIVVPVHGDWQPLLQLLAELGPLAGATVVISVDPPPQPLPAGVLRLAAAIPGRGQQLAQGVDAIAADWYWLLHADSRPGTVCVEQLESLMRRSQPVWGRFDVTLEPRRRSLDIIAFCMNLRSRLTGICTGDQGMFVHHALLEAAGGVPRQSLMEDIELSARLRRLAPPVALPGPLGTSARRWNRNGVIRTILSMWSFRLCYWAGVSPVRLANAYYQRTPDRRSSCPEIVVSSAARGAQVQSEDGPSSGDTMDRGSQ